VFVPYSGNLKLKGSKMTNSTITLIETSITNLETAIDKAQQTNQTKTNLVQSSFKDVLSTINAEFVSENETTKISMKQFLLQFESQIITEKTSIIALFDVITSAITNRSILHNEISYANMKNIIKLDISKTELKKCTSDDDYSALIKKTKTDIQFEFDENNADGIKELRSNGVAEMERKLEVIKRALQLEKSALKKAAKK